MPCDGWTIVLAALTVFRLALMMALEDGPGEVLVRLRSRLGCYDYDPDQRYPDGAPMPSTRLGRWYSCPMCVSLFPVSPLVVLLVVLQLRYVLLWLGLAGICTLLFRWRTWK